MAKLKEKILRSLRNNGQLEVTLNEVSQSQENLLKNHSNPVFSNKDKNKILKGYADLQNIGKSLHRYNTLQENNYINDAQDEKEDIENKLLKTGISYYKYVWHAENSKNTCDKCKELDGQVFDFEDEVPERPHPNCRCKVKVIEAVLLPEDESNPPTKNPNPQSKQESPQQNPQTTAWILPVAKGHKITSFYGYRMHPVHHTMKLHDGIDINALANTPVYAVADGKVTMAQWYNGYGNYVEIDHGNGIHSFYGHLNSYNVNKGDIIKRGQVIAKSGNTGIGTGAHLHFGVHKNGSPTNPLDYLPCF